MPDLPIRFESLFYREADRAWEVASHTHPVHQWFFCLHGRMTVSTAAGDFPLMPEQSVLIPPQVERWLHGGTRSPGYFVAIFTCPVLPVDKLCSRLLTMPGDLREDVHALVAELRSPRGSESRLLQDALVLRLLIGHLRAVQDDQSTPSTISAMNNLRHEEVVAQVERFLTAHLHRTLTRDEIAAAVHLSVPHLARLFRAATGKTMMDRLTELRLARAKELLLEPDAAVTQVAGRVGFASFSHFARLFRQHVGVPPSDFRRGRGTVWH